MCGPLLGDCLKNERMCSACRTTLVPPTVLAQWKRPKPAVRILLVACLYLLTAPTFCAAKERTGTAYAIPLPPKPDFSALEWLVGEWAGQTTGPGPKIDIQLSVSLTLGRRFMLFQEQTTVREGQASSAAAESWMGILGARRSGTGFVLWAFSDAGFATSHGVVAQEAEVLFNPEGGPETPSGWLFRRLLRRVNSNEMVETVQAAPPGKPFFDHYTAKLTRATPPE